MTPLAKLARLIASESVDGQKLLKNPNDNPVCALSVDEEARCITLVWRKYATSAQLRFIHEILLDMLKQHNIGKLLGDDTELPVIHADDQHWIVHDWAPRAQAAGLKAVAATTSLSFFGMLSIRNIHMQLSRDIAIRRFDNIHTARDWLSGQAVC